MKNIITTLLIAFSLLSFSSCMDLDRAPLDKISEPVLFKDEALTKAYLYNIYNYMPCGYGLFVDQYKEGGDKNVISGMGITDLLDGSTDLLRSPSGWNESNGSIIPGTQNASYNPHDTWGRSYEVIRKTNNMLANLKDNTALSEDFVTRVSAETRFVRAFIYFDLVRRYGDVPLIKEVQRFDNLQILKVPRDNKEDIYDFIETELDEIGQILPFATDIPANELGRASREAAWALNGRAMLFAERYEASAKYSRLVLEGENSFGLEDDYNKLFQSHGGSKEVIFEILFDGLTKGHAADNLYLPPSINNGWGAQTNPTQELVDSYEMLDGTPFDWNNPSHAGNPYAYRDKRLEASIIYDESKVKNTTIRTAYLEANDGLGLQGTTYTGYYIRKFMDETLPFEKLFFGGSQTSWKEIRLAEVLLNYAEAQNEFNNGPDDSVYEAIDVIRNRAGLPPLPRGLDKVAMFQRIQHERKVELAFEGHRFWDLRRWKLAESILHNKYFHGMKITVNNDGSKNYEVFEVTNVPRQVFLPKHYLMPIHEAELEKNPNLGSNNPGY